MAKSGALRRVRHFAHGGLSDEQYDNLLSRLRQRESGDRNVPNGMGSGAFGPYQFMPGTWDDSIRDLEWNGRPLTSDDRSNPDAQDYVMRQRVLPRYIDRLDQLGLDPTPGNILMLHRLGEAGGPAMISAASGASSMDVLRQFYPSPVALERVYRQNPYLGSYDNPRSASDVVRAVYGEVGDPTDHLPGGGSQELPVNGTPGPRRTGALRNRQVAQAPGVVSDASGPPDPTNPTRPVTTPDDENRIMQMRREIFDNLPTPQARNEAMRRYQEATDNLIRAYQARRQQGGPNVPLLAAGAAMMQSQGPGGWGGVLRSVGEGAAAGARALSGERDRAWEGDALAARTGQEGARFGVEEQDRQYRAGLEGLQRAEQALLLPDRVAQMRANTDRAVEGANLARARAARLQGEQAVLDSPDPLPISRLPPAMRHDLNVTLGRINRNQIERNARQEVESEQQAYPVGSPQRMTPQQITEEIARRRDEEIARLREEAFTRYNAIDPTRSAQPRRSGAGAAAPAPGAEAPPVQAPPASGSAGAGPGPAPAPAPASAPAADPGAGTVPPSPIVPPAGGAPGPSPVVRPPPDAPSTLGPPPGMRDGPGAVSPLPPPPPVEVPIPPQPAAPAGGGPAAPAGGGPAAPAAPAALDDLRQNPPIDVQPVRGPEGMLPPSPFAFGSPDRAVIERAQSRYLSPDERRAQAQELGRMTRAERENIMQRRNQSEDIAQALDQFEAAMQQFRTGRTAPARVAIGAYLRDLFGLRNNTATFGELAEAATRYLQPRMRVQGSGATSDNEMRWFMQSLPNLRNTPEGNQFIIDMFRTWGRQNAELYDAFARAYQQGGGLLGPDWFNIRDQAVIRGRAEVRTLRGRIEEYLRNNPSGTRRQSDRFAKGGLVKVPGQQGRVKKLSGNFHKAFLNADT